MPVVTVHICLALKNMDAASDFSIEDFRGQTMSDNKANPCDLCEIDCYGSDCPMRSLSIKREYCAQYKCFLNYEGGCLVGLNDSCGAWKEDVDCGK